MKSSAFAIIKDRPDSVLLCHRRDADLWNLPGGGVDNHESPWQAVVREVKEEVCLDVTIARLCGIYWKKANDEISFLFECEIVGGEISLTSEADKIEFFDVHTIPTNTSIRQRERILDSFKNSGTLILKDQDIPFNNSQTQHESDHLILYISES